MFTFQTSENPIHRDFKIQFLRGAQSDMQSVLRGLTMAEAMGVDWGVNRRHIEEAIHTIETAVDHALTVAFSGGQNGVDVPTTGERPQGNERARNAGIVVLPRGDDEFRTDDDGASPA